MKIYFDQNVLGWLAAGRSDSLKTLMKDGQTYVYSRASFEEISKCDNVEQYLDLLATLEAQYIELIMDDGKFTDNAHFFDLDPSEAFHSHINNMNEDHGMSSILGRLAFKLSGGKTEKSFEELSQGMINAIGDLTGEIRSNISESFVDRMIDLSKTEVDAALDVFQTHMSGIHESFRQALSEQIQDEENFEGIMTVRRFYGTDKSGISNIEPPNIVEKIWKRVEDSGCLEGYNISREQFLGLVPYGDKVSNEFTVPEKIYGCYQMLNWVGYWPDKKIRTKEGFSSSFRDADHAVYAAYCDKFITADQRLAMKMRAAYEHLKIGTQVVLIVFETAQE